MGNNKKANKDRRPTIASLTFTGLSFEGLLWSVFEEAAMDLSGDVPFLLGLSIRSCAGNFMQWHLREKCC